MSEPDDLADLLAPRPGAPAPGLQRELLRQAERHLTRTRWLRRAARVVMAAGIFVAGGATAWLAQPETVRVVEVAMPTPVPVIVLVPTPVADAPGSPTPEPVALSASEAELRAEQADDRTEAAKLYRDAGDSFLRDQDYTNATRCYRLFLTRAGDDALSPAAGDSWLLTSLKNALFKEKVDVPKTTD